jgi:hypothetical protein
MGIQFWRMKKPYLQQQQQQQQQQGVRKDAINSNGWSKKGCGHAPDAAEVPK